MSAALLRYHSDDLNNTYTVLISAKTYIKECERRSNTYAANVNKRGHAIVYEHMAQCRAI